MKRLRQFYNTLKIQTKFTITHLVIATIPMIVLGAFFYTKLYDMIVSDTIRTEQNNSAQTAPLIEDLVAQVLDTHEQIVQNDFHKSLLASQNSKSLDLLGTSTESDDFVSLVADVTRKTPVTDVRIYLDLPPDEDIFSASSASDILLPIQEAYGTYWHGIFSGSPGTQDLFCPPFYLSPGEVQDYGELAYITKSTISYNGEKRPCYTAIYYSQEPLTTLLQDNLTSAGSVAYLINERDNVIATSDEALVGAYPFDYDSVQKAFMSSNNFILKHVMGNDVYAGFYNINNAEWYMVVAMPSQPMIEKSFFIVSGFGIIYLVCIIFALVIATLLSHSITNRISIVVNQMAAARSGPPAALAASEVQDEVGDLIDTYNYMARVINQLMDDQAKAAEELRIAEFNTLQAQINPHFLYNTMDMINWLAQQGRSSEVTMAIQNLSKFYKLTLSRKQNLSTIENEIEHVSIYIRLQNMRYHDMIDFLVDIPDNLMDYSIPKLTFQPVIENSILHGILEKDSKKGTIVLTGWLEKDAVVILISDDGVGISEEMLSGILSGTGSSKTGTNIAVYNTHQRLKILYGAEYGLSYTSRPGAGTEVEIRLPAQIAGKSITNSTALNPSLTAILREKRLNQALPLLTGSDFSISEIAKACEYADTQQFIAEFKIEMGCSPEEYREHAI